MSEYEEKVTRYARKLWTERNPVTAFNEIDKGRIEATKGWGGCDTCGYGDGAGVFIYLGSTEVAQFEFYNLDQVLKGVLDA